jgi:hypothetical protein
LKGFNWEIVDRIFVGVGGVFPIVKKASLRQIEK